MTTERRCPCGKPLHYVDPNVQADIERLVWEKGEFTTVWCEGKGYRVSRHYIALHGIKAWELEGLADVGIVERLEGTS